MVLGADHRRRQLGDSARDHRRSCARLAEGALIDLLLGDPARSVGADGLDAAGRLIADSLICGIAGAPFARSRALRAVLAESGGKREACLIGTRRRLPSLSAAMANAEAINLLDADDTFLDVAHFGGLVVAVALAEAQRNGTDWTVLRSAVARGFDINARLAIAARARPGMIAPGLMMLGATVAAVYAAGGNEGQAAAALCLAMRTAPTPASRAVSLAEPSSFKYAPYSALAAGAIQAARHADARYVSGADVPAFFESQQVDLEPTRLEEAPHWWVERTALKPWPSFRIGHPVLDSVASIVRAEAIPPGSIERIELFLDPRALALPVHDWPDPLTFDDMMLPLAAAMNIRLSAALVAAGIAPGPRWARRSVLRRADVRRIAQRTVIAMEPAVPLEMLEQSRDPVTRLILQAFGRVRLKAGGKTYVADKRGADGDRTDWDWLRRKANAFLGCSALVDSLSSLDGAAPCLIGCWHAKEITQTRER